MKETETHHSALLPADVEGVQILNTQTLLVHVEAPQPLAWLASTTALRLKHTPAEKQEPHSVTYVFHLPLESDSLSL